MLKRILATTALATVLSAGAHAQPAEQEPSAGTDAPGTLRTMEKMTVEGGLEGVAISPAPDAETGAGGAGEDPGTPGTAEPAVGDPVAEEAGDAVGDAAQGAGEAAGNAAGAAADTAGDAAEAVGDAATGAGEAGADAAGAAIDAARDAAGAATDAAGDAAGEVEDAADSAADTAADTADSAADAAQDPAAEATGTRAEDAAPAGGEAAGEAPVAPADTIEDGAAEAPDPAGEAATGPEATEGAAAGGEATAEDPAAAETGDASAVPAEQEAEAAEGAAPDPTAEVIDAPRELSPDLTAQGFVLVDLGAVSSEDLSGAQIRNVDGEDIATVDDVILTMDGQVESIVAKFGGFLGFGSSTVALSLDEVNVVQDGAGEIVVLTELTPDDLKGRPEFGG